MVLFDSEKSETWNERKYRTSKSDISEKTNLSYYMKIKNQYLWNEQLNGLNIILYKK